MRPENNYFKSLIFVILVWLSPSISNGSIVVLTGLTHENVALPGETYRTAIEIQNVSQKEKSVQVYPKDYWYSHTGETKHDPPGTIDRSNANWVTFQPELITLAANEKTTINVEVQVPQNEALTGTYWCVLMVEGIVPPDTTNNKGVSISTAIRYAVQFITTIGETGKNDLGFLGLQLTKLDGQNVINVLVENTGERLLKPEMSLELFDGDGNSVGLIKADRRKNLPGTSIKVSLVMEGIKPGTYTGVIIADCGGESIFGTNVSFDLT